jgi:transposase
MTRLVDVDPRSGNLIIIVNKKMKQGKIIQMNVCGIDVSKDTLEVVIRKEEKSQKSKTFENSPEGHLKLIKFLIKQKIESICLEATGSYHFDITILIANNEHLKIMVINPRAAYNFAKAMMQRTKTDAIDAEMLAQYADRMAFVEWQAPATEVIALRTAGRWLAASSKELTRLKNQLHAFESTQETPDFIIGSVEERIKALAEDVILLEKEAHKLIEANENLMIKYALLLSMTGIGDKTALKLLGEIMMLPSDMSAKQWVAHAGLFPQIIQSGSSVNKKTRIGKAGNRYIRGALYMPALVAAYRDPNISGFYWHLVNDNGLRKIQALCAVMRKLLLSIHAMFRTNTPFNGECFYTLKEV